MKIKFSKKLDPSQTKPVKKSDLIDYNKKLHNLSKKIHKEKFFEIKKCLICNSKKLNDVFSSRDFKWTKCEKCNHLQKKAMPEYENLLKFYEVETVENYLNEVNIDFRIKNLTKPKYDFIKSHLSKTNNKSWLDLASGLGDMPYFLTKKGWKVTSTEIYDPFIEFAQKKLNICHKKMLLDEYFNFHVNNNLQNFDVVGALGYFDILPNPLEHSKIINRLLKKNGSIAVNIPINDSLSGILSHLFPEDSLRQITPMDFSVFSKKSVFKMLELSGFEITSLWFHGLDYYELISKIVQKSSVQFDESQSKILLNLFNDIQKVIDKNKLSDLLLICAKKIRDV